MILTREGTIAVGVGEDEARDGFGMNEKMRAHKIIFDLSSFRQKVTGGSWGAIIRMPVGISSMVGI